MVILEIEFVSLGTLLRNHKNYRNILICIVFVGSASQNIKYQLLFKVIIFIGINGKSS